MDAVEAAATRWQLHAPIRPDIPYYREQGLRSVARLHSAAESPIELALAPWLVFGLSDFPPVLGFAAGSIGLQTIGRAWPHVIVAQFPIASYRADFALVQVGETPRDNRALVAVACDGAAYHDPAADAVRDAALAALGIPTVRASGTAIYKAPLGVVARVRSACAVARRAAA
jgi:very-short-patch-repair endonuclease